MLWKTANVIMKHDFIYLERYILKSSMSASAKNLILIVLNEFSADGHLLLLKCLCKKNVIQLHSQVSDVWTFEAEISLCSLIRAFCVHCWILQYPVILWVVSEDPELFVQGLDWAGLSLRTHEVWANILHCALWGNSNEYPQDMFLCKSNKTYHSNTPLAELCISSISSTDG